MTRMFPIMGINYNYKDLIYEIRESGALSIVVQIPWDMIAPHEAQAKTNHGHTLMRLAERGGLGPAEALAVFQDRRYRHMPRGKANLELLALVTAFLEDAETKDGYCP